MPPQMKFSIKASLLATVACVLPLAAMPAMAQARAAEQPQSTQPLDRALQDLSETVGVQILFNPDVVRGKMAGSVTQGAGADAALGQILSGTGLTYRRTGDGIYSVVESSPASSPQPRGMTGADASPQRVASPVDADATMETILVTGSRIASGSRDTVAPVDVIDSGDIILTGTANLELLLNASPQFTPSNTANTRLGPGVATADLRGLGDTRTLVLVDGRRFIPYDQNFITDINTIPSQLVKRVEIVTGGSSAVYGSDAIAGVVNFIMRDDFEGLEASGQYRIYGEGDGATLDLSVSGGGSFANGRGRAVTSINYLEREPVSQADRPWLGLYLEEARDAQGQPTLITTGSSNIPNGRFSGIPTGSALNSAANAGLRTALTNAGLAGMSSLGFTFDDAGRDARPYNRTADFLDTSPNSLAQKAQERWAVFSNVEYDLTPELTGFMQFAYSNNYTMSTQDSTGLTGQFQFEVDNPYLSAPLQEVLRQIDLIGGRPDGLVTLSVARRLVEVGNRNIEFRRNAFQVVLGGDTELGDLSANWLTDLDLNFYYSIAQTEGRNRNENGVLISAFQRGLLRGPGGTAPLLNVFGQNISAEGADSLRVNPTNSATARLEVASAAINGTLVQLPAGPAQGVIGAEWRKSEAVSRPDDILRSGDVSGIGRIPPTDGSIEAVEAFGELRLPLLSEVALFDSLTATGAFRYSSYDIEAVGGVWTYSGGAEWRPVEDLLLRGQYQRATRAPNAGELFGGQTTSNPAAVDPCAAPASASNATIRALCVATGVPEGLVGTPGVQPNVRVDSVSGGNPELEAETSNTFTAGFVLSPSAVPGLRLSADYFSIELEDAISPLGGGTASILNLCYNVIQNANSAICRAINRNPVDGAIVRPFRVEAVNQNIGQLETSGVDFGIDYQTEVGALGFVPAGSLSFSAQGTWFDTVSITPLQDLPNEVNQCAGAFGAICGEPRPEFRTTSRATYSTGPLKLSLRHRFIDEVTLDQIVLPREAGLAGPDEGDFVLGVLEAQHYFDLTASYDLGERATFTAGVKNLFDREPPPAARDVSEFNTFPSTYDPLGREFFVSVTTRF